MLEIPGQTAPWVVEVKRSLSARPGRGFHNACEDIQPARRFVVYAGNNRYPLGEEIEAVSLHALADELIQMKAR